MSRTTGLLRRPGSERVHPSATTEITAATASPVRNSALTRARRILRPRNPRAVLDAVVVLGILIVAWQVVGQLLFGDSVSFVTPVEIVAQTYDDRNLLPQNVGATLKVAILGYIIGNLIAFTTAAILVLSRPIEKIVSQLALTLYALPTLVLAPILGAFMGPEATRVSVAALVVFFPAFISTCKGLRDASPQSIDLVYSLGGGRLRMLWLVRLRWSLPAVSAGFRIAVPNALLGAIAAEWLGADRGLGIFMVNALGYLNAPRVWACVVICVVITLVGYALVDTLDRIVNSWTRGAKGGAK